MGASLCPWMLQRANSQQEQFPLPAAPHQCPSTPWGPLPAHLWHSKEHFAARHLQRILWVLLSQQLVPDKSQMPQECRLCSHSVTNPHCTAPLGRQCGKCQCSQIWSPRRTVSTTHSKAGQPEPEDRVASTHLPRWQRAVTPGRHLLCKDFIPYPVSGCCFHWRKSPANNKKINKYKSQEEAASKLHYFTWAFSSHHRKQLVFSRKNQKMVVHLSLPCGAEQKEAPAVAPSPLGLKAAQRPSLQPQQGLQGLGTAV